jgi:two-component system LytT family sensor kinase
MKQPNQLRHLLLNIGAAWLAIALFDATQTVVTMRAMGMHHAWTALFFVTAASWIVWPLATPGVLFLLQRYRLPSRSVLPWFVHGLAYLAIDMAWSAWSALLEHLTNPLANPRGPDAFADIWYSKFIGLLIGEAILYGAIMALNMTLDAHKRLAQEQAVSARTAELLAQTQLATLRLQLEPHFVFNSLNAVTGLIREQRSSDAITVITALGDLLRRVTDQSDNHYVALEDEVAFLRKYLDIQQMRFGERLHYAIAIPEALMKARVPDFILQGLVENAIKHGIAKRAKGGTVRVEALLADARLTLTVYNDGPPLPAQVHDGVGLSNTRQRLAVLYGAKQTFALANQNDTGVLATITLPYSVR